jgi:DNA processing protein
MLNVKHGDYYALWLNSIDGVGYRKIARLLKEFGSPKGVYDAEQSQLRACVLQGGGGTKGFLKKDDVSAIMKSRHDEAIWNQYRELGKNGINMTYPGKEDYPAALELINDPPHILFYKGRLPDMTRPRVAVVGTRRCSNYGRVVARELGEGLAKAGIQVVSGMAMGIDSHSQRAALDCGGASFGVLGCGVDVCYPQSAISLYMDLQDNGGVISEYLPGTKALAGNFPARNRILSGISQIVVVVEAMKKSGSLITANYALEQGREVMAVPGRVGEVLSEGCNDLIRQGAHIYTCVNDVVELLGLSLPEACLGNGAAACNVNNVLAREHEMVYGSICLIPKSLDNIIEETGLDGWVVSNLLLELELLGVVQEIGKNHYIRSV